MYGSMTKKGGGCIDPTIFQSCSLYYLLCSLLHITVLSFLCLQGSCFKSSFSFATTGTCISLKWCFFSMSLCPLSFLLHVALLEAVGFELLVCLDQRATFLSVLFWAHICQACPVKNPPRLVCLSAVFLAGHVGTNHPK